MEEKDVDERVMAFIAQHWPVRKNRKLAEDTRLAQDLGMEGDDAVEFFDRFAQEFEVDLYDLRAHWNQHFAPEGSLSLAAMAVIALCVTAGFWLRYAVGVLPAWAWGIALIAIAAVLHYRFTRDSRVPITVGDLSEAARLRRWNKPYFGSC